MYSSFNKISSIFSKSKKKVDFFLVLDNSRLFFWYLFLYENSAPLAYNVFRVKSTLQFRFFSVLFKSREEQQTIRAPFFVIAFSGYIIRARFINSRLKPFIRHFFSKGTKNDYTLNKELLLLFFINLFFQNFLILIRKVITGFEIQSYICCIVELNDSINNYALFRDVKFRPELLI